MGSPRVSACFRWFSALAGACLLVLVQAGPGLADGGLDISSDTTYEIRADEGLVRVTAEYVLKNTLANEDDGFYITRFFYKTFTVAIPNTATNLVATRGSTALTVDIEVSEDSSFDHAVVMLRNYIYSGQTQTINLTYDLPSEPVRSDRFVRVNPAFSSFGMWGVGDAGQTTVRLLVPDGFAIETVGDELNYEVTPDGPAWIAREIADPDEWYAWVAARDDSELTSTHVSVDGRSALIRAWPDDPDWEQFAVDHFTNSVPVLEELIGVPWPVDGRLEIIETVSPSIYGSAGWFLTDQDVIEITEHLDPQVMLHELAHAWFSRDTFGHRWLTEGLAEELSYRTLAAGGEPLGPFGVFLDPSDAFQLNTWEQFSSSQAEDGDDQETYGYDASAHVVRQITREIGMDGLQLVLQAADSGEMAYAGDVESDLPRPQSERTDWKRFLDLAEQLGATDDIAPIFERYVVTDSQALELDLREDARRVFAELEAHGDSWVAPISVRLAMEDWRFSRATDLMEDAEAVLELRDIIAGEALRQDVQPHSSLKDDYEGALHNVHWVIGKGEAQLAAIEAVTLAANAVHADRDLWASLGLWGADLDGELDRVRAAFESGDAEATMFEAVELIAEVEAGAGVGMRRAGLGAAGVMISLGLGLAGYRLKQRSPVGAERLAEVEGTNSSVGWFDHPIFELEVEDFSSWVRHTRPEQVGADASLSVDLR